MSNIQYNRGSWTPTPWSGLPPISTKLKLRKPIKGSHGGCLYCGYQHAVLPLWKLIAVGFGSATVTVDRRTVFDEIDAEHEQPNVFVVAEDFEKWAAGLEAVEGQPRDWRIHLIAPMSERHYQRQGPNHWVLYKKGMGFA